MKERSKTTSLPLAATRTFFHPSFSLASGSFGIVTKNFMETSHHAKKR
jgi:hypothetical protein